LTVGPARRSNAAAVPKSALLAGEKALGGFDRHHVASADSYSLELADPEQSIDRSNAHAGLRRRRLTALQLRLYGRRGLPLH
jgi:hypothetical protein